MLFQVEDAGGLAPALRAARCERRRRRGHRRDEVRDGNARGFARGCLVRRESQYISLHVIFPLISMF